MVYATIIVLLAIVQFQYFGVAVGRARGRHEVKAPAVHGDEQFERFHRAHQNTLEQLIAFIPAIYACAYFSYEWLAIAGGLGYVIGRFIYFRSYIADPETRGPGMIVTMLSTIVMLVAGLLGAVRQAIGM